MRPGPSDSDQRQTALEGWQDWLETPLQVLALLWLILLVVEVVSGANPVFDAFSLIIWGIFLIDFGVRLWLTPEKKSTFLMQNWLVVLSLLAPAFRLLRLARFARVAYAVRAARGARLVRVIASINRGMGALSNSLRRSGFAYVVGVTVMVALAGAAGMKALESGPGFETYGDSLWFTAMILTTLGTSHWPQTAEGRVLCFLLALYAFATFGYITATLATFLLGRDIRETRGTTTQDEELKALREEVAALHALVAHEREP